MGTSKKAKSLKKLINLPRETPGFFIAAYLKTFSLHLHLIFAITVKT